MAAVRTGSIQVLGGTFRRVVVPFPAAPAVRVPWPLGAAEEDGIETN